MTTRPTPEEATEVAAWHGLATNPTIPPAERLPLALKALEGYERLLEEMDGELATAEERGYRHAVQALRDRAKIERDENPDSPTMWAVYLSAADHLEHAAAAPRNEGEQT